MYQETKQNHDGCIGSLGITNSQQMTSKQDAQHGKAFEPHEDMFQLLQAYIGSKAANETRKPRPMMLQDA